MTGFTTVPKTVARQVTRFTTVAKTVSKKTIGLAHMHFAPSDDSCVFVRTDSAPFSDSYGLLHTGCKRFIDHAAAADARVTRALHKPKYLTSDSPLTPEFKVESNCSGHTAG